MSLKPKKIKKLKFIITTLLVIAFTVLVISCKEATAEEQGVEEQEEEKGEVTIPSETKEETQETTPETEVIDTSPVEDEGVLVPYIEGLKYDAEANTYFAGASNPYGLEVGEKAGVFVKDAVEINGVMENSIALRSEVIKYLQEKILEEKNEIKIFIPFDVRGIKELKINLEDNKLLTEANYIEKPTYLGFPNLPEGTIIYSPLETNLKEDTWRLKGIEYWPSSDKENPDGFSFNLNPLDKFFSKEPSLRGVKLTVGRSVIQCAGAKLLLNIKDSVALGPDLGGIPHFETEGNLGMPLFEIIGSPENNTAMREFFNNNSFIMYFEGGQYRYDEEKKEVINEGYVNTGKDILMEQEGLKISYLPADE